MNKNNKMNKVICIGMHKTGTSSIGLALIELGYIVLGARVDLADALLKENIEVAFNVAEPYSALQDVPWALLYKELDKEFPNSKFILTERDEKKWLNSVLNHFGEKHFNIHKWIYGRGIAKGNEELYLNKYREHNKEVKKYFKDRPEDFIIVSFANGDGWKEICNFLGHSAPNIKFPIANKGRHNWTLMEKIYDSLRKLMPGKMRRKILDLLGFQDRRNRFHNQIENSTYIEKGKDYK